MYLILRRVIFHLNIEKHALAKCHRLTQTLIKSFHSGLLSGLITREMLKVWFPCAQCAPTAPDSALHDQSIRSPVASRECQISLGLKLSQPEKHWREAEVAPTRSYCLFWRKGRNY